MIKINLLAEAQAGEELRRRDPVKRSMYAAGSLVFLMLLWSAALQIKIVAGKDKLDQLDSAWKGKENLFTKAEEDKRKLQESKLKYSALDQFATNRFLWGNTLNALQQTSVENVHLTRLRTEQVYTTSDVARPRSNNVSLAGSPAASATEKITITLDAKDYSSRASDHVTKFKEIFTTVPYFQNYLQKTNGVLLTSLSAPQSDPRLEGNAYVMFELQLFYQEKEHRLHE